MLKAELTEDELKSQLIGKLDKLNKEQLLLLCQAVSRIIADELTEAVTHDWKTGKVNRETIQKTINDYRDRNPY